MRLTQQQLNYIKIISLSFLLTLCMKNNMNMF